MTEMNISTRGVETFYNKVLDKHTKGADTVSKHETKLSSVEIGVHLRINSNDTADEYKRAFDIEFRVNHVDDQVKLHTVSDDHSDIESLRVDKLCIALDAAKDVLNSFLKDIGLDYTVITRSEFGLEEDVNATVHNNLENAK